MAVPARPRSRPLLGWMVFAACCLWAGIGAVTGLGVADYSGTGDYFAGDAAFILGFTGLGALVVSRQPRNRAGVLCLTAGFSAVSYLCGNYALLAAGHGWPGAGWATWVTRWIWLLGLLPVLTLLLMVLPDGHLPHPRWRPVAWAVAAVVVALPALWALVPAGPGEPPNPVAVAALAPVAGWGAAMLAVLAVCCAAGLSSLVHRLFLSTGRQRSRVAWIALGAWVFAIGKLLDGVLAEPVRAVVGPVATAALPVACGVAILRYDLLELNRMLRSLLSFVVLGTVLTAAALGLRELVGTDPLPATAAAVLLALTAPVLHRWLGGRVSRLLYGSRGSPGELVAGLGRRLARAAGPDDVLAAVADAVAGALPVTTVHVVLAAGGAELRRVTRGPAELTAGERVALRFQGAELGRIEVAPTGGRLDTTDRALLHDLAAGAAAALAAAHRATQLQVAHEQLVAARAQERRRIARDLHDGVGPVLSGLGFTLDALRVAGGDRAAVVAQARAQVREAVALVRRVATDMRPAGLDRLGLAGALRELAAWHEGPALRVEVAAGELGEIDAATEVAAHAIVAEAVTNVARHSGATWCRVTLVRAAAALDITVDDDGIGVAGAAAGFGRTSMVERAAELGGTCRADPRPEGGSRVTAHLPLRAAARPLDEAAP